MSMTRQNTSNPLDPHEYAQFKFALIAPVLQNLYPDKSENAYYERVTANPLTLPNGTVKQFKAQTLGKWVWLYRVGGYDSLLRTIRTDKGTARALPANAIEHIYELREKYPRLNATMLHTMLVKDGYINDTISVRTVQRFVKNNDLKSARNTNIKDRKAFEEISFGRLWQSDTCYLPAITENGVARKTYLIMIIDDHSRMIVGGEIFYNDNAYNYQKVLKKAIETYGIPDKLYLDNGSPYSNSQLSMICASVGTVEIHTPVRDGASKGKVERNFRTLKERWVYTLDTSAITSLTEFNQSLAAYIRKHNTTVHSAIGETPLDRYMRTSEQIKKPKSQEWLDECFHNRITRKVRNDATITIDGNYYDVPARFIGMKVELRYIPGEIANGYILYEHEHFPLVSTDKNANCRTKRNNNFGTISYARREE